MFLVATQAGLLATQLVAARGFLAGIGKTILIVIIIVVVIGALIGFSVGRRR
jgi:membrane protein DedA with SNARE-associated domain